MKLVYVTQKRRTYDQRNLKEINRILGVPVTHRAQSFSKRIKMLLEEVAAVRVRQIFGVVQSPCFIEESSLSLGDENFYFAGNFFIGGEDATYERTKMYLQDKLLGKEGVASIVVAFTDNGKDARVFQGDIPGKVVGASNSQAQTWWETMWQPRGYERNFAEIIKFPHILDKRSLQYLKLAEHLDLPGSKDSYEAHVTVECNDLGDWDRFSSACDEVGIKGIQIKLPQGEYPTHLITASWHKGTLNKVREEVYEISKLLTDRGFKSRRHKIESMMNNSQVPTTDNEAQSRPLEQYFEFHVKVRHKEDGHESALTDICEKHGAHLSRSTSNRVGSTVQRFITTRYRVGRDNAIALFEAMLNELQKADFKLSNRLKEYTVFDDNLDQDRGWADSVCPSCPEIKDCPFTDIKIS